MYLPGVAVGELELLTELGGVMSYSSHITPVLSQRVHIFTFSSSLNKKQMLYSLYSCHLLSVENDLPLLTLITVTATHFAHLYFSNLK